MREYTTPRRHGAIIRLTALEGKRASPSHQFDQELIILGSGTRCDVALPSQRVDEAHAAVVRLGNSIGVSDLGAPGGTMINGKRVRWELIHSGSIITLGPFSYRIDIEESPGCAEIRPSTFGVRDLRTNGTSRCCEPVMVIGSHAGCDVVLNDTSIAPRQAVLAWTGRGPILRNLRAEIEVSINGVHLDQGFVDGGSVIAVGRHEFQFEEAATTSVGTSVRAVTRRNLGVSNNCETETRDPVGGDTSTRAYGPGHLASGCESSLNDIEASLTKLAPVNDVNPFDDGHASVDRPTRNSSFDAVSALPVSDAWSNDSAAPRLEPIDEASSTLRARVAAAQDALDERARKLWQGLNTERERLTTYHSELHARAKSLGESTIRKQGGCESDDAATARTHVAWTTPDGFGGLAGRDGRVQRGDVTKGDRAIGRGAQDAATVRDELNRTHTKLEVLGFEIDRLRDVVDRGSEQYRVQHEQLNAQIIELREAHQNIQREKETVSARMRQLEGCEVSLRSRISEVQRRTRQLETTARDLARSRAQYEAAIRDMRASLEAEGILSPSVPAQGTGVINVSPLPDTLCEPASQASNGKVRDAIPAEAFRDAAVLTRLQGSIEGLQRAIQRSKNGGVETFADMGGYNTNGRAIRHEQSVNIKRSALADSKLGDQISSLRSKRNRFGQRLGDSGMTFVAPPAVGESGG